VGTPPRSPVGLGKRRARLKSGVFFFERSFSSCRSQSGRLLIEEDRFLIN